jgi:hypothetical protein
VRRFDLPPIAVGQPQMHQLTRPHRGMGIYTTFRLKNLFGVRELGSVAAFGPTAFWGLGEYISVAAVTAAIGSALTAIPFKVLGKIP